MSAILPIRPPQAISIFGPARCQKAALAFSVALG